MNEKSKAFELIEFVWNNEKTDSYLRVNIAMYEAVKLAIISQMKFNKEDFQNIFSKFSGGYWFGVNANGKGYGENFYRKAVTSGNISACQSYEAFCNIKPFIDSKGRRLCKGAMYRDNEKRYRVTGFDFSTKKVYLVGYAISDWEEKGKESESSYQFTVEVLFHKGMFCYKNKACGFTPLWYVSDRCEVIGNAFDNPELMKEGVQP